MAQLCIALLLADLACGSELRSRFNRLKAEGRAAIRAKDYATAESRYRALLDLSASVRPSITEMYADVVSPLAEIYKDTEATDKLEGLYQRRLGESGAGLDRGLAQADLGFFYQASEFASVDRLYGERLVDDAVATFEQCAASKAEGEGCRRRLADTAGIQGAIFFQRLEYARAEPQFRRVINLPEAMVQEEVMLISLHALRGIMILRKQFDEAKRLELRAAAFEAAHPNARSRLKAESSRSRSH